MCYQYGTGLQQTHSVVYGIPSIENTGPSQLGVHSPQQQQQQQQQQNTVNVFTLSIAIGFQPAQSTHSPWNTAHGPTSSAGIVQRIQGDGSHC